MRIDLNNVFELQLDSETRLGRNTQREATHVPSVLQVLCLHVLEKHASNQKPAIWDKLHVPEKHASNQKPAIWDKLKERPLAHTEQTKQKFSFRGHLQLSFFTHLIVLIIAL